jgi:HEAT repeat protein
MSFEMARLLDEARRLLHEGAPLDTLEARSERETLRTLTMLLNDAEAKIRQRACWELGRIVSRMAPSKIEDYIRRLMWRLNPESGDNPFGVPEALGEIGNRAPRQIEAFVSVMMQYLDDERLRTGLLQAAGRIGQKLPNVLSAYVDEISSYLRDDNAAVAGNAALALRRIGGSRADDALRAIEGDNREIALFCGGAFRTIKLCELARQSCEGADDFCFIN